MRELVPVEEAGLPADLPELDKLLLVADAAFDNALRARTAILKELVNPNLSMEAIGKLDEALEKADEQMERYNRLRIEIRQARGAFFNDLEKGTKGSGANQHKGAESSTRATFSKSEKIKALGYNKTQVSREQQLDTHADVVAEVLDKKPDSSLREIYKAIQNKVKKETKIKKREARQKERAVQVYHQVNDIWLGDMAALGSRIPDNSIDLILTDPPYPYEYITCWTELSRLASRVLKPGGLCVAYSGQMFLPEVIQRMSEELEYVWTFAIRHTGGLTKIFKTNMKVGWKPVLCFVKPPFEIYWDSFIDITQGSREKDLHEWQQAEVEAAHFIENLTIEDQVVLDPFAGSGTTLSAAKKLNRKYLGIELDAGFLEKAKKRVG